MSHASALVASLVLAGCATTGISTPPSAVPTRASVEALVGRSSVGTEPSLAASNGRGSYTLPQQPSRVPSYSQSTNAWNQLQVDAFFVPAIWFESDEDSNIPSVNADIATGLGGGARVGIGSSRQGIGLSLIGTTSDERTTGTSVDILQGYVDFRARTQVFSDGVNGWLTAGGGFGLAGIDFESSNFDDETTGAMQLRFELDVEVTPKIIFDVGLSGYLFGWPGDTYGYGTYVILGGKFYF